jgi:hypothetical protein
MQAAEGKRKPRSIARHAPGFPALRLIYIGSGQLPMDDVVYVVSPDLVGPVVELIGSGQLPIALTGPESAAAAAETTAGAATVKARAPAKATEAAIFLNIMFPNASRIRYGNCTVPVDIHCKMFSTETVKAWVKRHL